MAKGKVHHWKHGWIPLDAFARAVVARREKDSPSLNPAGLSKKAQADADRRARYIAHQNAMRGRDDAKRARYLAHQNELARKRQPTLALSTGDAPGNAFTKGAKYDTPVENIPGMTFSMKAANDPLVRKLKADPDLWEQNVPTVEYQLGDVKATEKYLRSKPINKVVSGAEPFRSGYDPYVLRTDDGDVIIDGHHRYAMYAAMGKQSAPVKLLDVRGGKDLDTAVRESRVLKDVSDEVKRKAAEHEPEVTDVLVSTAEKYGGQMEGLEDRLKAGPSLVRKIRDKAITKNMTPEQYSSTKLGDSLRYTMIEPPDNFTQAASAALADFQRRGFTIAEIKNSWPVPDTDYKGLNTTLRTPDGLLFEVQFHTPESLAAKSQQHKDFELARDLNVPPEQRRAALKRMVDNMNSLSMPPGIESIVSTEPVVSSTGL
jgi:hypothetical protein